MMQFNPLFFNINQASPELSKPDKFGSISYLFSDIIKVLLNESPEEQKTADTGSSNNELETVLNLLRENLCESSAEKPPEQLTGRKFKITPDETGGFSIQALFAAAADSILDKGINISIKKDSEELIRQIEISSEVPESEAVKTISIFLENLNKNSGQIYAEKIPADQDLIKISSPSSPPESGLPETEMKVAEPVSYLTENDSVKFNLESPEEILTLELSKPLNSNPLKIDRNEIKIFNGFPEPEQSNFKLKINYAKISGDEQFQKPVDSSFEITVPGKLLSGEQDISEKILSGISNRENYKESRGLKTGVEKLPVNNLKKAAGTPSAKSLNEEIKFKVELQHKKPEVDGTKSRDTRVSNFSEGETAGAKDDNAGISGLPKAKPPVFFKFEITKAKESSGYQEIRMPQKSVVANEEIKTISPAGKNENEIIEKYTKDNESTHSDGAKQEDIAGFIKNKIRNSVPQEEKSENEFSQKYAQVNESTHSDPVKQEDASQLIKSKIQNSIPADSNKNSGINSNTGQPEMKEIPLKENLPLPFFKHGEMRSVSYPNLTEEISRIIKDNEIKSVTLKLEPEELGKVKIVLEMISSGIKANIEVTNEAVRQSMQSNIEQLKENLIHQGVQLNSLNVTLNNNEQKPVKTFNQKKSGYSKHSSEEEVREVENLEAPAKKLGYNTYEYLI